MKQSFGQKGAGGRFLALALALIMLCSVLVPAYAAVVDEQGVAEQNEPAATGSVTYIFYVGGETVQEVKVASGEALTKPTDPDAPEGEVFKGWFVDNDLNKPFTFGTTVSTHADETVHLYAHFETAVAASTEQQPVAPEQPAAPGTSEEPKQPETNTPTDGGEENKGEQGSTENNENQTGENQNTENTGKNTTGGENTTPSDPTTPTDPVTPTEPIVPAEPQPTEGEVQPVDELYNRLMACATLDEINAILNNLTEEEDALLEQFTEEQNATLEAKMNEFGAYETDTMEARDLRVKPNNSVDVLIDRQIGQDITVTERDENRIAVSRKTNGYGYTIAVAPNVMPGDYTLKVTYTVGSGHSQQSITDTITVHVYSEDNTNAAVFYLKSPLSDPDTNNTDAWCDEQLGIGSVNTTGATWGGGYTTSKDDSTGKITINYTTNKNIFKPKDYVMTMPDEKVLLADGTWELPKTYTAAYTAIFNAYKAELEEKTGIKLTDQKQIEAIYLIPYKISKDNGGDYPVHIDCKVSVKIADAFTVTFWVITPDGTVKQAESRILQKDSKVKNSELPTTEFPETWHYVDGKTYRIDGWYREDDTCTSNKLSYKHEDNSWPYTPTTDDLEKGTINFYAHYVPITADLVITKTVTGRLGSDAKSFEFSYSYVDSNKETQEGTFYLKDGESTSNLKENPFESLPVGTVVTITETSYTSEGYTTYYTVGSEDEKSGNTCEITLAAMDGEDNPNVVTFRNDKNPVPDTGLTLDSWPYLLALCFVTLGAVVTLARGRRRDVD